MEIATPFLEAAEAIVESGGKDLNLCYQCATCTASCPWGWVRPLNMRQLIRMAQFGLEGYEGEDLWRCATCGTCKLRCPRGVGIIELVESIRRMIGETGLIPRSLRGALATVASEGNPWSGARGERNRWADGVLPRFERTSCEYLLFACCMPSYDARSRRIARAAAKVLQAAGITAGVLDDRESCCGESARRAGGETVFASTSHQNLDLFREVGAQKILVLSPHCYHTFRNEYPRLADKVEIVHMADLLARLLRAGKLIPAKPLDAVVTYHDPCYLGRHNRIFDAPRDVIEALPGVKRTELIRNRDGSLCCGGGGGRMWLETKVGERFSDLRVPEAIAVGATVLATACPYCVNMFESSRTSLGMDDRIEVKDLSELVADSLG